MKSYVRELIEAGPETWLATLQEKYKIHVVQDGDLVSLKYNQIESPMAESIVQECRGMVVCTRRKQVMGWGYNKFWNHGEHLADRIDWSTARVQTKADGSLILMWWDPEHDQREGWRVASSGHPTAGGRVGKEEQTFADLFWQTWDQTDMRLPPHRYQGTTFCFELCTPTNRIIVRHSEPYIVLHGARDEHGNEIPLENMETMCGVRNWPMVEEFQLTSLEECLYAAERLDPLQQEGFVVVDQHYNRVKIKSPRYVALHHLKGDAMTTRRAIELWQTGECSELLANFPELEPDIRPVHDRLDNWALMATMDYAKHSGAPTRKDFAMAVKDRPHSAVMFRMHDKTVGDESPLDIAKAIMRKMTTQALERMLEAGMVESAKDSWYERT